MKPRINSSSSLKFIGAILCIASANSQAAVVLDLIYDRDFPTTTVMSTITLDDSVLGNSYNYSENGIPPYVIDYEFEVIGASGGNGYHSVANGDIVTVVFSTNGNLPTDPADITFDHFGEINFFHRFHAEGIEPSASESREVSFGGEFAYLVGLSVRQGIPEPGSLLLLSLGGLVLMQRRSR